MGATVTYKRHGVPIDVEEETVELFRGLGYAITGQFLPNDGYKLKLQSMSNTNSITASTRNPTSGWYHEQVAQMLVEALRGGI